MRLVRYRRWGGSTYFPTSSPTALDRCATRRSDVGAGRERGMSRTGTAATMSDKRRPERSGGKL